jgi:hypothetical protein
MLNKMSPKTEEALRDFEVLMTWVFALQAILLLAITTNFICAGIAAVHAAKRRETAWTLVIIFFPFVGWIAYWLGKDDKPSSQIEYVKAGPIGPAGQMGRTEHDVANEVSAQISEEIRRRRLDRGR